jgi:hypothetical protein
MRNAFLISVLFSASAQVLAAPVTDVPPIEVSEIVVKTSLDQLDYKTAVQFRINNPYTSTSVKERAERGVGDDVLAKYDVLIDNIAYDPNQGVNPASMQQPATIDFTVAEDTAQGWVRMGTAALPALNIMLNGKSGGHASASWRTNYTVPGVGLRSVGLKFRIPETVMDGRFEFSGRGPHQVRVKVQVLVNGYPVWWSEAIRAAQENPNDANDWEIHNFGETWTFSASSEKANAKWVTASLGKFNSGTALNVAVVYFVDARVDERCKLANNMYACMGINAGFKRDNTTTLPEFTSSPVTLSIVN